MGSPVTPVVPLQTRPDAITSEIPKVKEHRPFDPAFFILAVRPTGIYCICLQCGRMSDDSGTPLDFHDTWARQHWTGKHT